MASSTEYQAQVLADLLGQNYFQVLRHLDSDRPNAVHLTIAALARQGSVKAVITTINGANQNTSRSALRGITSSLISSFRESATGCNRPCGPTRIGPNRTCMCASILRSIQTITIVANDVPPKIAST